MHPLRSRPYLAWRAGSTARHSRTQPQLPYLRSLPIEMFRSSSSSDPLRNFPACSNRDVHRERFPGDSVPDSSRAPPRMGIALLHTPALGDRSTFEHVSPLELA